MQKVTDKTLPKPGSIERAIKNLGMKLKGAPRDETSNVESIIDVTTGTSADIPKTSANPLRKINRNSRPLPGILAIERIDVMVIPNIPM